MVKLQVKHVTRMAIKSLFNNNETEIRMQTIHFCSNHSSEFDRELLGRLSLG